MDEVELDLETGELKFRAKGPASWVEERLRQVLGLIAGDQSTPAKKRKTEQDEQKPLVNFSGATQATQWMRQNGVSRDDIDQVFSARGDGYEVIAAALGATNKAQNSINAYLLQGLAAMLGTGEPKFADGPARKLCEAHACYDTDNHASTLKKKRNLLLGNSKEGWELTKPGLGAAAALVKKLATPAAN